MSREAVEELMDRWINEPSFREELRHDARGTVERSGLELNNEEWSALHSIDWALPDEELQSRVSKIG